MKRVICLFLPLLAAAQDLPRSATDYGAKCDGVTDDTAALRTAIASASAVRLPQGTCIISGPLRFHSGSRLSGVSRQSTIRVAADTPAAHMAKPEIDDAASLLLFDASGVTLEDFTFDANHTVSGVRVASVAAAVSDIRIERLSILNSGNMTEPLRTFRHNIEVWKRSSFDISRVWIEDNFLSGAAGDGVYGGDNISIGSYDHLGTGVTRDIFIRGNYAEKAGRNNISLESTPLGSSMPANIVVEDCILADSSLAGIDLESATNAGISNIRFINSGRYTGYYTGRHEAQLHPDGPMRTALLQHGGYPQEIPVQYRGLTFVNPYRATYGINQLGQRDYVSILLNNDQVFKILRHVPDGSTAALRLWADTSDNGYVDATSGSLNLQVDASTKLTIPRNGPITVRSPLNAAAGLRANNAPGLTVSKTVKGSDGKNCSLTFTSGLLTGTTCR
jgi:hypothetical protein